MAELRVVLLAALAGCSSSEAAPTSGLLPPAGWQALPSIAAAAKRAATESKIAVEGSEAWGDPARGCYGAWLAISGGRGNAAKMADDVVASISKLDGITLKEIVKPATGSDELTLGFERAPYRGHVRATLGTGGHI